MGGIDRPLQSARPFRQTGVGRTGVSRDETADVGEDILRRSVRPVLPEAAGQVGQDAPCRPGLETGLDLAAVELDAALGVGGGAVRLGVGGGRKDDLGQVGEGIGEGAYIKDELEALQRFGVEIDLLVVVADDQGFEGMPGRTQDLPEAAAGGDLGPRAPSRTQLGFSRRIGQQPPARQPIRGGAHVVGPGQVADADDGDHPAAGPPDLAGGQEKIVEDGHGIAPEPRRARREKSYGPLGLGQASDEAPQAFDGDSGGFLQRGQIESANRGQQRLPRPSIRSGQRNPGRPGRPRPGS